MKTLLLISLLFISIGLNAQRFGLKFAWSQSDINNFTNAKQEKNLYQGYEIGIYGRSDSRIYLQPEIYYQKKEGVYANIPQLSNFNPAVDTFKQEITLHTINIPLVLGLNVIKHKNFTLHGFAGIQSSVVVDNKITSDYKFKPLTKNNIENITVKYFYGVGFDLFFLSFDIRYYNESVNILSESDNIQFPSLKNYYTFNIGLKLLR